MNLEKKNQFPKALDIYNISYPLNKFLWLFQNRKWFIMLSADNLR